MGVFELQGDDGKTYEVDAPDMATAAAAFKKIRPKPRTTAPQLENLPSVYSQFKQDLEGPMGSAATLGASDAQLSDVVRNNLGDRFVRFEPAGDYTVAVTRGPDGKEQRGYVNQPGLDTEDVVRGIRGSLPYFLSGGVAGAATRGAGLLGQAAAQGVAGAATSVAGDVAQAPLGSEQGIEGGKAAVSGMLGMGIPLASRAVGNVATAMAERMTPLTGALKGFNKKAVRNVEEAIAADPTLTQQSIRQTNALYGPQTMLGDMGQTLQSDTAMLARTPVAKDVAATALKDRQSMADRRIADVLDNEMGVQRNLPQYMQTAKTRYSLQAKPFYDQFYQAPVLASSKLRQIMARIPRSAYSEAERLAKADGVKHRFKLTSVDDPMTPMTGVQKTQAERVIQGVEYDYLKRAVDDMARSAAPGSNEARIYANLARDLRNEVDSILSPSDPRMSPWAQARAISGEGIEGREAAELGSQVFGNQAKDPHLVQTELSGLSAHGTDMYREGARNKLRQVMGRAKTAFGSKGDTAARQALNSEFSRENLGLVTGKNSAQRIADAIDAENQYARLHDMALSNSVTDTMQAARKRWAPHTQSDFASEAAKKGPIGVVMEGFLRVADKAIGGQIKKAEIAAMVDGAKILTARGKARDEIIDALFKHVQDKQAGRITGQKYEKLVRNLLEGSRGSVLVGSQSKATDGAKTP